MKINNIKSRLLAGTLALSMVFSLAPSPIYAADDGTVIETVAEENTEATTENDNLNDNTEVVTEVTTESTTETVTETPTTEVTTEVTTEDKTEATTEVSTEKEEVTDKEAETTEDVTEDEKETDTEEATTEEDTEEVVVELVEFDHYFSTIDESLVNTSDLLVQTDNAGVFTKNTNVVSNYDDVYIISCDSVEQARYTYSYYVDKVNAISDMSNVISMANEEDVEDKADLSDINNGNDALSNLNDIDVSNYSNYIALIDSGANADVNYSVVGDNTSDTLGHGTKMLQYIKEENPNAKVMSIKVFDGNTTNAANVYAGIKLAIESKVKVINLSLVGANVEKNAIVKDVIQEALDNGIIVIGAAGNYGVNAKNYISGCIDGVITVGAANEDGTKLDTSNYNADVYVVANSTSEATARYSGMYTANNTKNDRVFTKLVEPTEDDENEQTDTQYDKIVA